MCVYMYVYVAMSAFISIFSLQNNDVINVCKTKSQDSFFLYTLFHTCEISVMPKSHDTCHIHISLPCFAGLYIITCKINTKYSLDYQTVPNATPPPNNMLTKANSSYCELRACQWQWFIEVMVNYYNLCSAPVPDKTWIHGDSAFVGRSNP